MCPFRMRLFQCLILLIILFIFNLSSAEVTTDGTMGQARSLSGPAYTIPGDLGVRKGNNLFHSFSKFNVNTDESATFTGPSGIENVIGRVTGGNASWINGLLACEITGANLWLLNPFGVLFGPDAKLDITGSFYASTADYLTLSGGGVFYTDPGKTSRLTTALPEAFGFLSTSPARIDVSGSYLKVPDGKTLSLTGGDIQIRDGQIVAPGGHIILASLASPGVVTITPDDLSVTVSGEKGDISVSGPEDRYPPDVAAIDVSGSPNGRIDVNCGSFTVKNTRVEASNHSDTDSNGGISIVAGKKVSIDQGAIGADVYGEGKGGNINIQTTSLSLVDGGEISCITFGGGVGGNIAITAEDVKVDGTVELSDGYHRPSMITCQSESAGDAGSLTMETDSLSITNGGRISAQTYGEGIGGNIKITAKAVSVDGGIVSQDGNYTLSMITCQTESSGNAGGLEMETDSLSVTNGGQIFGGTLGDGFGGNIKITAKGVKVDGTIELSDGYHRPSMITCQSESAGDAGSLTMETDSLSITNGCRISAQTYGEGTGGNIKITAKDVSVDGGIESQDGNFTLSMITCQTESSGDAGNLEMETNSLSVTNGGQIFGGTLGDGVGGSVKIIAKDVKVDGAVKLGDGYHSPSMITCQSESSGAAGSLEMETDLLSITNGGRISAQSYGEGVGGNIKITAKDVKIDGSIESKDGNYTLSMITCQTESSGDAGSLEMETDALSVTNGGQIFGGTLGDGVGGNIKITAKDIKVDGAVKLGDGYHSPSMITCQSESSGDAGSLEMETDLLSITNGGRISAQSYGGGVGGNIKITAKDVKIDGSIESKEGNYTFSTITCQASSGSTGHAGNIYLTAYSLMLNHGGQISTATYGMGDSGDIRLDVTQLSMANGSRVESSTESPGAGGGIRIEAGSVTMTTDAVISSASTGTADAGDIIVAVADKLECRNSTISTESVMADGGDITLSSIGFIVWLIDSSVTATVGGGPQTTGGNIRIDSPYIVLKDSQVIANAYEGKGGSIHIDADTYLADWTSTVSASSTRGISGEVEINSPLVDLSGLLSPLPTAFADATELFANDCETRYKRRKASSLIVRGREALPAQPGDLCPSPIVSQ